MRSMDDGLIHCVSNAVICCSSWGNGVDSKNGVICACSSFVGVV